MAKTREQLIEKAATKLMQRQSSQIRTDQILAAFNALSRGEQQQFITAVATGDPTEVGSKFMQMLLRYLKEDAKRRAEDFFNRETIKIDDLIALGVLD